MKDTIEIIGVRFKKAGKVYYFDPAGMQFKTGSRVVVETTRGLECGDVVIANRETDKNKIPSPLKHIVRPASKRDLEVYEQNRIKEKEAFAKCVDKIAEHNLEMKLIDVEYTFDNNKILFYFSADGRVDFRELVKDLAGTFHTRIELRQIGVRDESKLMGGIGICGRSFCCNSFLGEFQSVSIKMAKEQNLSLNPSKISGTCGRLMCCLKYEQDMYEELLRISPKMGAYVKTPEGSGYVVDLNLLTGLYKIRLESKPDAAPVNADRKDLILIKDSEIKLNKSEIKELKELEGS
ncbi:MAG: stage 0 sporulation family protein [Oscillospiraceae bacterium]|nr:stage 0 sporulation family protein [Oscillospiraceae bacterium]